MNLENIYMGVVEDNNDPLKIGRVKVRVSTLYNDIKVEDIPYAYPLGGLGGKSFQLPKIGSIVNILFLSDDIYSPCYVYSENYNESLQKELNGLSDEEYRKFTSLLFDESTKIFVENGCLTMEQSSNKITIDTDSINLELSEASIINLGSRESDQEAVLGDNFFNWMDEFIDELSNLAALTDSTPGPITYKNLIKICSEYKNSRPTFVSNVVKIMDNE